MPNRRRAMVVRVAALLLIATGGCAHVWQSDVHDRNRDGIYLRLAGPDANYDFNIRMEPFIVPEDGMRMFADVGRCLLVQTNDGLSRLDYPAGTSAIVKPPHVAWTISQSSGSEAMVGTIQVVREGDPHVGFPAAATSDYLSSIIQLLQYFVQPFERLPDRLATVASDTGPVPPAVLDLMRDLAGADAVAIVGELKADRALRGGMFTCQMTLSDAGRAKLRAALARRSRTPLTELSGSAAGPPTTSPTR